MSKKGAQDAESTVSEEDGAAKGLVRQLAHIFQPRVPGSSEGAEQSRADSFSPMAWRLRTALLFVYTHSGRTGRCGTACCANGAGPAPVWRAVAAAYGRIRWLPLYFATLFFPKSCTVWSSESSATVSPSGGGLGFVTALSTQWQSRTSSEKLLNSLARVRCALRVRVPASFLNRAGGSWDILTEDHCTRMRLAITDRKSRSPRHKG